jgi:lipid A disaccharide synthetase
MQVLEQLWEYALLASRSLFLELRAVEIPEIEVYRTKVVRYFNP